VDIVNEEGLERDCWMNGAGTGHQVDQTANCCMRRRRRTRNTNVGAGNVIVT
jgi:hypothetical protein